MNARAWVRYAPTAGRLNCRVRLRPNVDDGRHPGGARRAHPLVDLAALPAVVQRVPRDGEAGVPDRQIGEAGVGERRRLLVGDPDDDRLRGRGGGERAQQGEHRDDRRGAHRPSMQDRGDGHGAISPGAPRRRDKHPP